MSPSLTAQERSARMRLARTPYVGPVVFRQLLERCGSAVAAIAQLPELTRRGGRVVRPPHANLIEREAAALRRIGGTMLVWGDPLYPDALTSVADAPPLLSLRGDPARLAERCVAIVGARNASANGQRFAATLALELRGAGLVVVSGLARGIDTAAHRGATAEGTIAVVAGGVDVVYPPENRELYDEICGRGGAVVSEMPLGLEPHAPHFPRRNRIISGFASAVVVVEATLRSGSLITARAALDQGREVLAVPGFPLDPRAAGPNALIRDGALLVTCADDVLAALPGGARRARQPETNPAKREIPSADQVDASRQAVLSGLSSSPSAVDELVRRCNVSAPILLTVLLELELSGRLQRHPGNQVSLVF